MKEKMGWYFRKRKPLLKPQLPGGPQPAPPPPPPPDEERLHDKPIGYLWRRESTFQVIYLTIPSFFYFTDIPSPWKDRWYTRHVVTLGVSGVRKRHGGMSR